MSVFNINLKKSENFGYGFSLLGIGITGIGSPHVIYEIISDSPAAEEKVEAGDIILKVNGTDVHRYTTKEVLKCLRLSGDPVTLELKRDPKIKAHIKKYLATTSNQHLHNDDIQQEHYNSDHINYSNPSSPTAYYSPNDSPSRTPSSSIPVSQQRIGHRVTTSDPAAPTCRPSRIPSKIPQQQPNVLSAPQSPHHQGKQKRQHLSSIPTPNGTNNPNIPLKPQSQQQELPQPQPPPPTKARFEAYMMTGDLILNLSRTPQSSGLIQPHTKKIDSLRDSPKHTLSNYGISNSKRKNGAAKAAPQAKYDSSLSSNSLSEEDNSSSIESVKKSTTTSVVTTTTLSSSPIDNISQQHQHHLYETFNAIHHQTIVDYNNKDNNIQQINKLENISPSDIIINKHNNKLISNDIIGMDSINNSSSSGSFLNKNRSGSVDNEEDGDDGCFNDTSSAATSTQKQVKSEIVKNLHNIKQKSYENDDNDVVDCYNQKIINNQVITKYSEKQRRQQQQRSESLSSSSSTTANKMGGGVGGGGSSNSSHDADDDDDELSYSVPTSPTSFTTPILQDGCYCAVKKKRDLQQAISAPTSPETSSAAAGGVVPTTASQDLIRRSCSNSQNHTQNGITRTCDAAGFRTSKSEDHLQHTQHRDGGIGAAIVPIDIDEDVNSSLNTLLDTRHDSSEDNSDRIVWTYNAPQTGGVTSPPISHSPHSNSNSPSSPQRTDSSVASPTSVSSSIMSSSGSRNGGYGNPMTCSGNSGGGFHSLLNPQNSIGGGEMSISEAISNISSPDYQDEHDLPSSREVAMALSDPSDSDSTLLVSDTTHQVHDNHYRDRDKIVIQVKGNKRTKKSDNYEVSSGQQEYHDNRQPSMIMIHPDLKSSEDELATLTEDIAASFALGQQDNNGREASPPISDDGSDVDSLHSFHYSPKAVDMPSAIRLAKRLYSLDGFKKSDVSRHLSKNNEFSRAVADEYLKYFLFERLTLDEALRQFLKQFALSGETQERERVLVHFSKRFLDCNPGTFNSQALPNKKIGSHKSAAIEKIKIDMKIKRKKLEVRQKDLELKQKRMELKQLQKQRFKLEHLCKKETLKGDNKTNKTMSPSSTAYLNELLRGKANDAVHTLTCAIMLLNTDLHGQNIGRKMTCNEFIDNLSELNDGDNFPKDVLKQLYYSIKNAPLEWAVDDESPDKSQQANRTETGSSGGGSGGSLQGPQVGPNPFLEPQASTAAIEYKKGYVMRKCCFESNYKKTPFGKRSWKMFYCTLRDLVLYLHKDEHGFRKNQMSDNVHNAIRIHHALATKANDYTKKQHVFRLQTADQSEYLFQTSDSKELQSWIDTINLVCAAFSAPPLEGGVGSQKRFQRPLLPCSHTKLLMKEQLNSHEEQLKKLEATVSDHHRGTLPTKGLALQNYKEKEAYLQFELKRYKTYVYLLCSRLNADPDSIEDDSNELLLKPRPPSVPPTSTNLHLNLNIVGGGVGASIAPLSTSPTLTTTMTAGAGAGTQQPQPTSPQSHTATNRDETM